MMVALEFSCDSLMQIVQLAHGDLATATGAIRQCIGCWAMWGEGETEAEKCCSQ